jgi:hypothetical protein
MCVCMYVLGLCQEHYINICFYYGVMHPVARIIKVCQSNRPPQRMFKIFLFILFIATCFGLSDGHLQVNRTNYSKKLLFLQRIRCV